MTFLALAESWWSTTLVACQLTARTNSLSGLIAWARTKSGTYRVQTPWCFAATDVVRV